jgi:RNA polymerase sigma-70 factor (ECF subfamily)
MKDESVDWERTLEDYRQYLRLFAQIQLDTRLQGKIDLSGVVQQTMFEAHQGLAKKKPLDTDHLAAWLRRILAHNLADEIRKLKTHKREVGRERSLEAALQQSSHRLEAWLAADQSSPSANLQRQEQGLQLCAALATLPDAQREALLMRHFHGWSLAQIAQQLGRSQAAVAGLLKRGLQQMRDQLRDRE